MRSRGDALKLPVPKPWQAAVRSTIDALCAERGVSRTSVAVTRVDEQHGPDGAVEALEIWLLVAGRGVRRTVDWADREPERAPA